MAETHFQKLAAHRCCSTLPRNRKRLFDPLTCGRRAVYSSSNCISADLADSRTTETLHGVHASLRVVLTTSTQLRGGPSVFSRAMTD